MCSVVICVYLASVKELIDDSHTISAWTVYEFACGRILSLSMFMTHVQGCKCMITVCFDI